MIFKNRLDNLSITPYNRSFIFNTTCIKINENYYKMTFNHDWQSIESYLSTSNNCTCQSLRIDNCNCFNVQSTTAIASKFRNCIKRGRKQAASCVWVLLCVRTLWYSRWNLHLLGRDPSAMRTPYRLRQPSV